MKKVNLAEQLNAFASGRIIDSEGSENDCFNFYDWFCKDASLERKANALFPKVKKFIESTQVDILDTYVFFKNNCPMNGPLYDDFRICDENGVLFTVIPKCGHSGKAEIWGYNDSGVFGCLKQAETFSKLFS
jgi:hypothetical protein